MFAESALVVSVLRGLFCLLAPLSKQNLPSLGPERTLQSGLSMSTPKCCVYVLRSCADGTRYYTGVTSDWRLRLEAHNAGRCAHTTDGRPWALDVLVQFTDERRALAFERYLKSAALVREMVERNRVAESLADLLRARRTGRE